MLEIEFEEKIFKRKRLDQKKLEDYGFTNDERELIYETELLGGEFIARIKVQHEVAVRGEPGGAHENALKGEPGSAHGVALKGEVIDSSTGEVYSQLRNPRYTGNFVGGVREAYEGLLLDIAEKCAEDMLFASDQALRITALIKNEYGAEPDFPWDVERYKSAGVFRHKDSGKWFALIMDVKRGLVEKPHAGEPTRKSAGESTRESATEPVDVMNIKIDERDLPNLLKKKGIFPAYHMSHKNWISIELDEQLTDKYIMSLVNKSFDLTASKGKKMDDALIKKVLKLADSVPAGRVTTYGELAKMLGMEKNSRLVGKIMSMADRYGDHPCHRVVNSAGRTVLGWDEQRSLLEAEGVEFKKNGFVDLKRYLWKGE